MAQALWIGAFPVLAAISDDLGGWYVAWLAAGLVLATLTAMVVSGRRWRFLGRAVLALEALGAGAGALIVLLDFLPYALGVGERRPQDFTNWDAGWRWVLAAAFAGFTLLGAAAGTMAGVLVSGARALWMRR